MDRCVTLVESTSPNSLLGGSLDSARRAAAVDGARAARRDARGAAAHARGGPRDARASTCSTSGWPGRAGVFGYDPLRLAIDVRGTRPSGYELARLVREQDDVNVELAGENVMVAVFGMGEDAGGEGRAAAGGPARGPSRR